MPVESTPESRMDGKLSDKPFIIECRTSPVVEAMAEVGYTGRNEKSVKSWDVDPPRGGPGLGSSVAEGGADCKSFENSFSSRYQNGTIYAGRKDPEGGLRAFDSSQSQNGGNSLQASEAESVSGRLNCDPRDREIVKGITHSGSDKDKNNSFESCEPASRSGGADLKLSSEVGAGAEDGRNGVYGKPLEDSSHDGGTSFDSSQAGVYLEDILPQVHGNGESTHRSSDAGVSFDGKSSEKSFGSPSRHEDHHHRHSRGSGAGIPNPALVERLYNPPHICNHVRCAANNPDYATKQTVPPKKYLVAKKHQYGVIDKSRRTSCDHDGGSTEKSRRACCDHDGGSTEKSRRASCDRDGRSTEKSRRASCDRDGRSSEKARRASCDHDGGSTQRARMTSCDYNRGSRGKPRRASCDHDKSYALHALTDTGVNGDKSRSAYADSDKNPAINTPAGRSRRTSVDSDRNHAHSSSGAPHHRRGHSTPPSGFSPEGPWNSSVSLDKKPGGNGLWSSTMGEKKHGDHGGWNSSVALDKKHGENYYGPWNGSVAIEKKAGERKDKSRSNSTGAAKCISKGDPLHSSRRTSTESSIAEDRRRKPTRSPISSGVAEGFETPNSRRLSGRAEKPNGSASPSVSGLTDGARSPPGTSTPEGARDSNSPSASVGSNHTHQSGSKDAVSWQRSQNSPDSSCVTSGDSPSCDSLSSITRGLATTKVASRARYELPTVASKLPKLSSGFLSQSMSGSISGISASCKPSWNSSTSKLSAISTTPQTVASVANTSTLARNFITKLKESAKTASAKVPTLPSWNSSITVAPNMFDCSINGSGASKIARKAEAKQSSKGRRVVTGVEVQVSGKWQSDNPHPQDNAAILSKQTGPTVPIPESSAEKHVVPGSVVSIPSTPTSKLTRYGSMRDSVTNIPTPSKFSRTTSIKEKERESEISSTLKSGKRGRTTWVEEARKNETVNLKKGETAERRLSEEYMTDHTLTTTVPRDVQGGRVKSLVHAFESLKTGPDAEHHHSADETVRSEYERELAAELAALPPSPSPIPA